MNTYAYEAVDATGLASRGVIEVTDQNEAVRRIKEMGLYPTRVSEKRNKRTSVEASKPTGKPRRIAFRIHLFEGRVKAAALAVLTRQLATLIEAGLPLLRGLKLLQQQETHPRLKRILGEISTSIESGSQLSEALAEHPRLFNRLYLNMVRAGEIGGALEISLRRLAEFMEKAQKIRGKVKSAMFYPIAVLVVAIAVLTLMLVFVVPRFKEVFNGLTGSGGLPAFTTFVLDLSDTARRHALPAAAIITAMAIAFAIAVRTRVGRLAFDQFKLRAPVVGPVFLKSAISRFARTLGTLLGSGVPVLQALNIVRDTAGNVVIGNLVAKIHAHVKEGERLTTPLRGSTVFPPMVVGMVDVGEQTGALPDMLLKIADGYDDEVDNAVSAMTSLLEPIMIVFLAIVVGSIVIAMFLPILGAFQGDLMSPNSGTPSDG